MPFCGCHDGQWYRQNVHKTKNKLLFIMRGTPNLWFRVLPNSLNTAKFGPVILADHFLLLLVNHLWLKEGHSAKIACMHLKTIPIWKLYYMWVVDSILMPLLISQMTHEKQQKLTVYALLMFTGLCLNACAEQWPDCILWWMQVVAAWHSGSIVGL